QPLPTPGKETPAMRVTWAAPGSFRSDVTADGKPMFTVIVPAGKPGLRIDPQARTVARGDREPAVQEAALLRAVAEPAKFQSQGEKPAGADEVAGVKAVRYELKTPVAAPARGNWRFRVWLHPTTARPVRLDFPLTPDLDVTDPKAVAVRVEQLE